MKCIYIYICTDNIHTCVYGARVCVCQRIRAYLLVGSRNSHKAAFAAVVAEV